MKTSELTGALLDYWVAKAEGMHHTESLEIRVAQRSDVEILVVGGVATFSPSNKWISGGPIIEREEICIEPMSHVMGIAHAKDWHANIYYAGGEQQDCDGPTPLIAAMRAYVASKFGEEVLDIQSPDAGK